MHESRSRIAVSIRLLATATTFTWLGMAFAQDSGALVGKVAKEYRIYLQKPGFKAFAVNGTGAYGYGYDSPNAEAAEYLALKSCDASRKRQRMRADGVAACTVIDRAEKE